MNERMSFKEVTWSVVHVDTW